MRVSKQWTDEGRTARKSGSGHRNVTSARENRRLTSAAAWAARKDSFYAGFLSRKTITACGYTGPMCIGAGVLIGSRSSFLTNPASICGSMMAEFVSGSMPVNGAFRSALSNATVGEHPELWSGVP
ncbi:hypothetical protein TNCV_5083501 [Trichonephila clavipes]|nr:hypothetical protein TNCV_5083501 [Trichonephila clavipes]